MNNWFWPVFLSGVALAAVGFKLFSRLNKEKRRFSAQTEAVVVNIIPCDREKTRFRPLYEYTAHGNPVRVPGRRTAPSPEAFTIGSVTVIRYDPHRPTEFIPAKGFDRAALFMMLGILGIVVTALSFLLLI